jgi:hypothetical protein
LYVNFSPSTVRVSITNGFPRTIWWGDATSEREERRGEKQREGQKKIAVEFLSGWCMNVVITAPRR